MVGTRQQIYGPAEKSIIARETINLVFGEPRLHESRIEIERRTSQRCEAVEQRNLSRRPSLNWHKIGELFEA